MQTLSARDLYHTTRRAMTRAYHWTNGEGRSGWSVSRHWNKGQVVAAARAAVLEQTGRTTLPRGAAAVIEATATHLLRMREIVHVRSLAERLRKRIGAEVAAEAERRGLPTTLSLAKAGGERVVVTDAVLVDGRWTVLLHAEGWAEYSRAVGRYHATLSILGGFDDNGVWAVRVPGTIAHVASGLAWLKPAAVRKAEEAGKRVLRQGDVWIVERVRDAMKRDDLPAGHRWDDQRRMIVHGDHAPVAVPFPAIAIRQSTLAASGSGRRRGD